MKHHRFYESKGINLDRVKTIGFERHQIDPNVIEVAAAKLHSKIKNGLKVKDIALVHRIWAEAKPMNRPITTMKLSRLKIETQTLKERVKELEKPWHRRKKWCWLHMDVWELIKGLRWRLGTKN